MHQGLLIIETSRSHSDTLHTAALLSASDQPVPEISIRHPHNPHNRQASVPLGGIRTPASERLQTHALNHAATGIGIYIIYTYTLYIHIHYTHIYII
jgi:hypothetical protein